MQKQHRDNETEENIWIDKQREENEHGKHEGKQSYQKLRST